MNRKIAAIIAADVAGYSKLIGEDEEETLRRLASYRTVFDDFIARASGRQRSQLRLQRFTSITTCRRTQQARRRSVTSNPNNVATPPSSSTR